MTSWRAVERSGTRRLQTPPPLLRGASSLQVSQSEPRLTLPAVDAEVGRSPIGRRRDIGSTASVGSVMLPRVSSSSAVGSASTTALPPIIPRERFDSNEGYPAAEDDHVMDHSPSKAEARRSLAAQLVAGNNQLDFVRGLRDLPPATILRHLLMERAGGLKQAYQTMDRGDAAGYVSLRDFVAGLAALGIWGSPIDGMSVAKLFQSAGVDKMGRLSLSVLLDYVPIERQAVSSKANHGETRTLWLRYCNGTANQRPRLARKPKWCIETGVDAILCGSSPSKGAGSSSAESAALPGSDWAETESNHLQSKRKLRRQLREVRKFGPDLQRAMVKGVAAPADLPSAVAVEARRNLVQKQRIEGAIRDCSKSRMELVDMQRKLASVGVVEAPPVIALSLEHRGALGGGKAGGLFGPKPDLLSVHEDVANAVRTASRCSARRCHGLGDEEESSGNKHFSNPPQVDVVLLS